MARKLPLVVVLGATACGKSKLAIDIARKFGGEIISADSMQVYRGLDIVTNKATKRERSQAEHHMIDFLDPLKRYSIIDFRDRSLDIIEGLFEKNLLPIIVGGTNYYIESLIWSNFTQYSDEYRKKLGATSSEYISSGDTETLIDSESQVLKKIAHDSLHDEEDLIDPEKFFSKPIYNDGFANVDSEKLWYILEKVDQESAHYFHPSDKRRIIRCLQVIQNEKKNYSDILRSANVSTISGNPTLGGSLRYQPTCVIWLSCELQSLDKMINERVEKMLKSGLLTELEEFHRSYNEQRVLSNEKPDYQKGIFQTIGFKEFHPYLTLDSDVKNSDEGLKVLASCVTRMKSSTRQYARRQIKWIRRRLISSDIRELPQLFEVPTKFDETEWEANVRDPAFKIVDSLINGITLDDHILDLKIEPQPRTSTNKPAKYSCDACNRTFIGTNNIESHLKSRIHERHVDWFKWKSIKPIEPIDISDARDSA